MSNLLDKSSILLTPTAYNNGKILSVKPSPSLNSELITNGDFSNGSTGWTLGSSWSIGANKAIFSDTISKDIRTSSTVFTANKKYQIKLTVADLTSGTAFFAVGDGAASNLANYANYANGEHTFNVTAPIGQELRIFSTTSSGSSYSITNISVKEAIDGDFDFTRNSSATRVNSQGLIEDITANLPRIDYTGGEGHWLLEPESTNLFNYSEDLANSYWSGYGNEVSSNLNASQINPIGTSGSYKLEGVSGLRRFGALLTVTPNTDYTLSFYAKNIDATFLKALFTNASLTNYNYTSEVNTTYWSRVEINFTTLTGTSTAIQILRDLPIGESIYLWGLQLEQQSYATSYVPTSGSPVTRLQDAAIGSGNSDLINSTEGVLYFEAKTLVNGETNSNIVLSDGTNNNLIMLRFGVTANRVTAFARGSGGSYSVLTINGVTQTDDNKFALVWDSSNFRVWINGTERSITTINSIPSGMNSLNFTSSSGVENFFGKTKCVAVFKEVLTDAELTCLTTI